MELNMKKIIFTIMMIITVTIVLGDVYDATCESRRITGADAGSGFWDFFNIKLWDQYGARITPASWLCNHVGGITETDANDVDFLNVYWLQTRPGRLSTGGDYYNVTLPIDLEPPPDA